MKSQKEDLWSDMHNMIENSNITKNIIVIINYYIIITLKESN
jgi:hypothetical protein